MLIILVSIFFRFFRLHDFQYWSVDEEGLFLSARRIFVDHKFILLAPSATTVVSMGPLLTYISAPLMYLTGRDPVLLLIFGSILGVITSICMFICTSKLFNKRVGLIAAFLYSSSFLLSFYDRRWWQLSLDSLLIILALFSTYQIILKKYYYSILLAVCIGFAWNADPSLLTILLATFVTFIIFKLPLIKKPYIFALIWIIFTLSPFLISEYRHPKSITRPLTEFLSRSKPKHATQFELSQNVYLIFQHFSRSLFTQASADIDSNFYSVQAEQPPLGKFYTVIICILAFIIPAAFLFSKNTDKKYKKSIKLVYIFILSFASGIMLFNYLTSVAIIQSYFLISWPLFIILCSLTIDWIFRKQPSLGLTIIGSVLIINTYALLTSSMTYPLRIKLKVVDTSINALTNQPFALYYYGVSYGFVGSGWDSLFMMRGYPPSWSTFQDLTKWIYQAYSLFATKPLDPNLIPQKISLWAADVTDIPASKNSDKFMIDGIKITINH